MVVSEPPSAGWREVYEWAGADLPAGHRGIGPGTTEE